MNIFLLTDNIQVNVMWHVWRCWDLQNEREKCPTWVWRRVEKALTHTRWYKRKLLNQYIYIDSVSNGVGVRGECVWVCVTIVTQTHISHLYVHAPRNKRAARRQCKQLDHNFDWIKSNQIIYAFSRCWKWFDDGDGWRGWEDFWFNISTNNVAVLCSGCIKFDTISTIPKRKSFSFIFMFDGGGDGGKGSKNTDFFPFAIVLVNVCLSDQYDSE